VADLAFFFFTRPRMSHSTHTRYVRSLAITGRNLGTPGSGSPWQFVRFNDLTI